MKNVPANSPSASVAALSLKLFGYPELTVRGSPPTNSLPDKATALLAYLTLERQREHSREELATLLWPESGEGAGRTSLRQALLKLRQTLPDATPLLQISRQTIAVDPTADLWLDVSAFTALLDACRVHAHRRLDACPPCIARLEQAIALYRDDFLAGFTLPDSDGFTTWQMAQRQILSTQMLTILTHVAAFRERRQEFDQAISHLRRALAILPEQEEIHRQLMRVLALDGQRSAALNQFETCRRLLAENVDIAPSVETMALRDQIEAGRLTREWIEAGNPYRGLFPFDEQHAADFHGRDRLVQRLESALEQWPLVAIIGPSGSGKSSLLRAGLLPRLHALDSSLVAPNDQIGDGRGSSSIIIDFWPGQDPFQSFADALSPLMPPVHDQKSLAAALRAGEHSLPTLAATLTAYSLHAPGPVPDSVLIVVDQFEELYTLCPDAQTRQDFLDLLLSVDVEPPAEQNDPLDANNDVALDAENQPPVPSPKSRITILLALRADFMSQALAYSPLADAIQQGGVMVGPMSLDGLHRAVEEPALNRGVRFERGLIERLLTDVGGDPGNLPLLQFCLTQLWSRQVAGTLTHAAYDEIGGLAGALSRYADHIFARLSIDEQEVARQTLMRLVQPGDGAADTRRWAGREELEEAGWLLVQQLADARLVVTDRTPLGHEQAALAHEALIQHWERLHRWLEQNQALRIFQHRLAPFVRQWEVSAHDDSSLLRGALLAEAEKFTGREGVELSEAERRFVNASIDARDQRQAELEARQRSELEQAQALARSEQQQAQVANRARQRLAWMAVGLTAALLVALVGVLVAANQSRIAQGNAEIAAAAQAEAERNAAIAAEAQADAEREGARAEAQARIALSRQLAAQAISLADDELDTGLLLSLESLLTSPSSAERTALQADLAVPPLLATILYGPSEPIYNLSLGFEGASLFSVGERGRLLRWDLADGRPITITLPTAAAMDPDTSDADAEDSPVFAFSNGGQLVAEAHGPGLTLWDVERGEALFSQQEAHAGNIDDLFFTADGKHLLSRDNENNLRLWNTDFTADGSGSRLLASPTPSEEGLARALSPAGDKLALTLLPEQFSISFWNIETGQAIGQPLQAHTAEIHGLTFSRDGNLFATASFDGSVRLWDAERGAPLLEPLLAHDGRVLSVAFSPDGRTLASGGTDNLIYLWDTATGALAGPPLAGHGNWVRALHYSENGETLFSADANGRILAWDVGAFRTLRGHENRVRGVGVSPDGRFLITGGFDGAIVVWDAGSGEQMGRIDNAHERSIIQIAISPDGRIIASADAGGAIKLWDMQTRKPLQPPLLGDDSVVIALTFSPNGVLLASGAFNGVVRLWDVATGQQIGGPLQAHEGWALSLAFSPDGAILASGSTEGLIKLWQTPDASAGETELKPRGEPLSGHENWVSWLVFNPDGQSLVSTSSDGTIRFWDVAEGAQLGEPLVGHKAQVWSAQFDPATDGQVLVTLGGNGSVLRWDVTSRELLGPPLVTGKETETMAISPDGRSLLIGSFDDTASQWRLDSRAWAERACRMANRNLDEAEWLHFMGDQPYHKVCPDQS